MLQTINSANEHIQNAELTAIVQTCATRFSKSTFIGSGLTHWLNERHPIYANKTPTDVNQFRGFLLSSLSQFPPNDELLKYVKSELLFSGHAFNIAAAAAQAARNFAGPADD